MLSQQELDGHRLRELRLPAPAAVVRVERALEADQRRVEHPRRRLLASAGGIAGAGRADPVGHLTRDGFGYAGARLLDLVALLVPGVDDALKDLPERRHAVPRRVGEIG